jgi:hypothetical protein
MPFAGTMFATIRHAHEMLKQDLHQGVNTTELLDFDLDQYKLKYEETRVAYLQVLFVTV